MRDIILNNLVCSKELSDKYLERLAEYEFWLSFYNNYLLNKQNESKKMLYTSSLLFSDISDKLKYLSLTGTGVLSILISDCELALDSFRCWEYDLSNAKGVDIIIHQIIKGDMVRANQIFTKWRDHESFKHDAQNQFFEGIFESNMDKMYQGISYFLTPEVKEYSRREGAGVTSEIFSFAGTLFTKLAWILGYELEFDSPNIDMELMPIQPLEEYKWPYDFELNNTDISMYK